MRAARSLAILLLASVALAVPVESSWAVDSTDWQSGDLALRVTGAGPDDPLPSGVAFESTSFANGPAGYYPYAGNSYYYDGSGPEEGGPDGVAIARVFQLHLSQVLAEDGTGLSEWQREQVCEGNTAWWIKTDAQLPAIDLSSLGVLAQLIEEGVVVPSGEWTGDGGWNPNLDGLIWSPKSFNESIDFVDTRYEDLTPSREWNLSIQLDVRTAGVPSWSCADDDAEPSDPVAAPEPEYPGLAAPPAEVVPPTVVAAEVPVEDGRVDDLPAVGAERVAPDPLGFAAKTEVVALPELTPLRLLLGALGVGLLWRVVRRRVRRSR